MRCARQGARRRTRGTPSATGWGRFHLEADDGSGTARPGGSSSGSRSRLRSARSACSSSAGPSPRAGWSDSRPVSAWPQPTPRTAASRRSGSPPSRTCSSAAAGCSASSAASSCSGWPGGRLGSEPGTAATVTERRGGLAGAYLSILGLTMTNPMTILSFGALFAGLGVTGDRRDGVRADHARRVPRLGGLVGRPHDRRRGAPVADHRPLAARHQRRVRPGHRRRSPSSRSSSRSGAERQSETTRRSASRPGRRTA